MHSYKHTCTHKHFTHIWPMDDNVRSFLSWNSAEQWWTGVINSHHQLNDASPEGNFSYIKYSYFINTTHLLLYSKFLLRHSTINATATAPTTTTTFIHLNTTHKRNKNMCTSMYTCWGTTHIIMTTTTIRKIINILVMYIRLFKTVTKRRK